MSPSTTQRIRLRSSRKALRAVAGTELIGLGARVVKSADPSLTGMSGVIVDETMNTVELEAGGRVRKLDKRGITIAVRLPTGEEVQVAGRELLQRPDERLKKLWKKVK